MDCFNSLTDKIQEIHKMSSRLRDLKTKNHLILIRCHIFPYLTPINHDTKIIYHLEQ